MAQNETNSSPAVRWFQMCSRTAKQASTDVTVIPGSAGTNRSGSGEVYALEPTQPSAWRDVKVMQSGQNSHGARVQAEKITHRRPKYVAGNE